MYESWGPGKYDPRYNQDGKSTPLVLPPAYGLAKVTNETYTAEGPISYWNAYVAVTQMGGQGNFSDPRLGIDVKHSPDLVTSKLPASARLPAQPAGASTSGRKLRCRRRRAWTHRFRPDVRELPRRRDPAPITTPGRCTRRQTLASTERMRRARQTRRTAQLRLRGLWQHPPYFHDGSAATLADVVAHYNRVRKLDLTAEQQRDLVEYLKSL